MPLTVFGANLIIIVICILWLFSGSYKSKFHQIFTNKLMIASIVFFCLHVVGLLWTEDLSWGLHIVHKMWYFLLLFPILFTLVEKDYIKHYIAAFLLAIAFTEIVSYFVWFELIEPFQKASVQNPTPFMSHISYNPILALAIYLVLHELFFNKKLSNLLFSFYSFFAISMTVNMFITGGRAGQVVFFVMLSILIFQILDKQRIKSLITIIIILPGIFFIAFQTSDIFSQRVIVAAQGIINYSENIGSSVGIRISYAINSWEIIKENPILGVGTGDYPIEYNKINEINTPQIPYSNNPHNMYTLILVQLGIIGLLSMLLILYLQIKISLTNENKYLRDIGITLPLIFMVVMLSDSYLLGHFTSLVFIFFSAFLYKDFEKN
jgi:O-antigen ligase